MKKQKTIDTARKAVEAFEAIELGDAFADAQGTAALAVADAQEAARAALFSADVLPTSSDVFAGLKHFTSRWGPMDYGSRLTALHARSLLKWPEFAEALRSSEVLDDAASAASAVSARYGRDSKEMASEARLSCMGAMAEQIAGCKDHPFNAAAVEFSAAIALGVRIESAKAARRQHVSDALAEGEARALAVEEGRRAGLAEVAAAEAEAVLDKKLALVREEHRIRQQRAAEIAERVRATKLVELEIGARLFSLEHLLDHLNDSSDSFLSEVSNALDAIEEAL